MYNTNCTKSSCDKYLIFSLFLIGVSVSGMAQTSAKFTFSVPNSQCGSLPVSFTNASTGTNLTYAWDFGDAYSGATNNTSTSPNPVHRFVGLGPFSVTLTVTSSDGSFSKLTQTVNVINPGIQLTGSNPTMYNGSTYNNYFRSSCSSNTSATLSFINQSSTIATNTFYRIVWGDGSLDYSNSTFPATPAITHPYNPGTYPILFIVTGQNGCIDTGYYYAFVGSTPAVGLNTPGNTSICTGTSLTFQITGTSTNANGTTYTTTFNDGTPTLTFTQAPPDITHTFLTTSCGITSPGYSNAFSATIKATNPCSSSSGTVVPIYVSQKPVAAFTISPNDTACVNSQITFTPTTISSYDNNGTCTNGSVVWSISPLTGWKVSSGSTGTDNGSTDPSLWTAGSNTLGVTFTSTGSYTITFKTGNPSCGQDVTSRTICINPAPIGNFTLDNTTGCTPLNVTATNTSNSPTCGSNTYAWNVTYSSTAACTPNTISYSFINGTNSTSANPQFQFINPGTYTISLVTKSSGGACTAATVTKTVTVKTKTSGTITSAATTCQNVSYTPTATYNCNSTTATYSWSFPGATPSTSTLASPLPIVYNTVGPNTISLKISNECGDTTITKTISVNPTPFAFVPPNQTYCAGAVTSAITLTSNITGTTFTWTNSNTNIGLGASGSGNIPSFTTKNTGTTPITATIKVTPINGCNGPDTTFTITVNPTPAAPVVTAAVSYCQGASAVPLIATPLVGDTLRWYTTPTGGTPSPTTPTPSTTTVGATNYYVSQVNSSGCESARSTIKVTVTAGTILSNATLNNPSSCASATGSIVLPGLPTNTSYKVTYTKNGTPVTINITSDGNGKITIPGLTSGTYDNIQVTPIATPTCPSNIIGPYSLVDPNPPATPTATSNSPLCAGATLNLTASSTATGTITYNWSGPNNFTVNGGASQSINNVTTAASGNYSVTITVAGCTSAAATIPVTINPIPTGVSASSNSPICIGDTLHLIATSTTTGNITYTWTGPNNFASPPQSTDIPNATLATGGTYLVTASVGNCSAAAKSITVTVNSKPIITDSSFVNPSSCGSAQGSISLKGLASNKSYVVNYVTNGAPITTTLSTDANGTLTISNLVAGTYSNVNVALASGGCNSNSVGPFNLVASNVSITVTASSNSPICSGSSLNLTATTNIAGATFSWTGPNGFTSSSPSPTINNATSAANGPYTVIATANGCSSSPSTIVVAVSSSAITANAGPAQQLCNTSTTILAANSAGSGTGTWKVIAPSTATVTQVNNPTSSINNLPIGITKVAWTIAGSCLPSADTMQITNFAPLSNAITPASSSVCIGQTSTLTGNTPTGGSGVYNYQWQQSTDGIIFTNIAGAISLNYTALPTITTYYRRSVSSAACTSNSDTAVINISSKGLPTVYAGTDVTICKGQSIQLSAIGASTFAWYPTQGLSCSTCAKPVASPNFTTNYILIGDNGQGCTGTDTVTVNVIQPLKLYVSANDTICVGQQAQLLATNADKYIWNPAIGLDNSTIANPIASPTFTIPYRVIGFDANNCFSDTGYVVVAVGKYPTVNFGTTGGLVTAGTAIQFSPIITNGPITTYRWTPTQYLSCTNCSNPLAIINKDVTYILEATNIYGCKGSDTISYKIICESGQVFIANAFTPDNDGVNDVLVVQGSGIAQVKYFRIFNRWGQLVFERSNFAPNDTSNGWDGKINGKLGNPEVYVYTAEVICSTGNTFVYKGNVTLIR